MSDGDEPARPHDTHPATDKKKSLKQQQLQQQEIRSSKWPSK
jgi:hypothetical protein